MKVIAIVLTLISTSLANAKSCSDVRDQLYNFYVGGGICGSIVTPVIGTNETTNVLSVECNLQNGNTVYIKKDGSFSKSLANSVRFSCTK